MTVDRVLSILMWLVIALMAGIGVAMILVVI